jgi:hypothetical protein
MTAIETLLHASIQIAELRGQVRDLRIENALLREELERRAEDLPGEIAFFKRQIGPTS